MDACVDTSWSVSNDNTLVIPPECILRYVEILQCEDGPQLQLPDWAIVRVAPFDSNLKIPSHEELELPPPSPAEFKIPKDVVVLAHPRGLPLKRADAKVESVAADFIYARFDVSSGSSGAPLTDPYVTRLIGVNAGDSQLFTVLGKGYVEKQCPPPGPDRPPGCNLQPATSAKRIAEVMAGTRPSTHTCSTKLEAKEQKTK